MVSGPSPFDGCSFGGLDGLFANAEVEPSLAVDPRDPRRLIVAYQQDRFSTGAARGLVASRSSDGGKTWARTELPFSLCTGGQTTGWPRASDPWVSIGPDGRAYVVGLGSGVAVSTSTDGGRRWSAPVTLAANDGTYLVDKCTVTADPAQAGVAYAVWQRYLRRRNGPPIESDTLLSVTRDGGRRWSAPRLVLAHTNDTGDVASVVLPGTRGALFHLAYRQAGGVPGPGAAHLSTLLVQRSSDGGRTWTAPRRIARIRTAAGTLRDPASGKVIRPGVASFALGSSGRLYAVWQDSRFGGGSIDQVAFSRSADGGRTWSKPRRLDVGKRTLGVVPTVAAAGMVVAVSYYAVSPGGTAPVTRKPGSPSPPMQGRRSPVGQSVRRSPWATRPCSPGIPRSSFRRDSSSATTPASPSASASSTRPSRPRATTPATRPTSASSACRQGRPRRSCVSSRR